MHADALDFLRWAEIDTLISRARCPLGRHWAIVDLMTGEMLCYRHPRVQRWSLRELIDDAADRLMRQAPRVGKGLSR